MLHLTANEFTQFREAELDISDTLIGKTRGLCNQRGYSPSHLNENFEERFIVHI
jgi:hypothetical protein